MNIRTNLIRCPHFMCGINAFFIAKKLNKKIIFADLDSKDWRNFGEKFIINRVLKKVRKGSIICFHDYLEGIWENKKIIPIIKKVILKLKERGYKLVTVSELIS